MSRRMKRGVFASVVLVLFAVGAAFLLLPGRKGVAGAQALPDSGKFRAGSALGEERAGFSGRTVVQVFATAGTVEWSSIDACLKSAAIEAQMGFFTGVLVDEAAEPTVEATLRERDGLRVVVRDLSGAYLGGLAAGFSCEDLAAPLESSDFS